MLMTKAYFLLFVSSALLNQMWMLQKVYYRVFQIDVTLDWYIIVKCQTSFCQTPVLRLGLGVEFTFTLDDDDPKN